MAARLLLVEDEPDLLIEIEEFLASRGHDVITARTGREALRQLAEREVDLVIADDLMPQLSGQQMLAKLRATPAWQHLPVIIVSAWTAELGTARDPAPDARLLKPFDLDELDRLVRRLLDLG